MKTVNIYTIDELSEKAKAKAIEGVRNSELMEFFSDLDIYQEDLKTKGFENAEIRYSGFYSQGDGASFTCDCNLDKLNNAYKLSLKGSIVIAISEYCPIDIIINSSRYCHENTMDERVYSDSRANIPYNKACDVAEQILEIARNEARQIYKSLEADYNYQHSDEYIVDFLQANEIEFLESGKIYN